MVALFIYLVFSYICVITVISFDFETEPAKSLLAIIISPIYFPVLVGVSIAKLIYL